MLTDEQKSALGQARGWLQITDGQIQDALEATDLDELKWSIYGALLSMETVMKITGDIRDALKAKK